LGTQNTRGFSFAPAAFSAPVSAVVADFAGARPRGADAGDFGEVVGEDILHRA
jgi:hypothetical protein